MKYPLNEKYSSPKLMAKIMGPNPMKLEEELLTGHLIPAGSVVCDLGSGQGLTSVFLAKEYGFTVYAADLWSDPEENRQFFREMGLSDAEIIPVKADATDLPFEKEFFDGVVSTDSYNYFGRDPDYLDEKLLPFVKKGGILIALKGPELETELAESSNALKELGGKVADVQQFTLADGAYTRNLAVIEKVKDTPKKYPRKAGTPQKKPL